MALGPPRLGLYSLLFLFEQRRLTCKLLWGAVNLANLDLCARQIALTIHAWIVICKAIDFIVFSMESENGGLGILIICLLMGS